MNFESQKRPTSFSPIATSTVIQPPYLVRKKPSETPTAQPIATSSRLNYSIGRIPISSIQTKPLIASITPLIPKGAIKGGKIQSKCKVCEGDGEIQRTVDISPASSSLIQRFDPLEYVPVLGKGWKAIKCTWKLKKLSDLFDTCKADYKKAGCDNDILSDECQDFMDGAGYPSDSILRCVQKKNPEAYKDALTTCGKLAVASYK